MADILDELAQDIDKLRQTRDEVRVRLHLLGADARDEWERLEKKWSQIEAETKAVGQRSASSLRQIRDTAKTVAEELRNGYDYIRSLMKED